MRLVMLGKPMSLRRGISYRGMRGVDWKEIMILHKKGPAVESALKSENFVLFGDEQVEQRHDAALVPAQHSHSIVQAVNERG